MLSTGMVGRAGETDGVALEAAHRLKERRYLELLGRRVRAKLVVSTVEAEEGGPRKQGLSCLFGPGARHTESQCGSLIPARDLSKSLTCMAFRSAELISGAECWSSWADCLEMIAARNLSKTQMNHEDAGVPCVWQQFRCVDSW